MDPTNSQILSTPGSFTYIATFSEHPNTQHFFLNHSFPRPAPTPVLTKMQRLARCRVAFLEFLGRTRVNVLFLWRISRVTLGIAPAAAGRRGTFQRPLSPVTLHTSTVPFLAQELVEPMDHKSPFFILLQLIHCSLLGCCTRIVSFGYAKKNKWCQA